MVKKQVRLAFDFPFLNCSSKNKQIQYTVSGPEQGSDQPAKYREIPVDFLISAPEKVAAMLWSHLGVNNTIFARNCSIQRADRNMASQFLHQNHIFSSTSFMAAYALLHREKVVAVATFGKGRRMKRLPDESRSFEMIRFCTLPGITVTGGLSKLVRQFCTERKAGEVMTYVDLQFSKGEAFLKAGFFAGDKKQPIKFMVDFNTFLRSLYREEEFDPSKHYVVMNAGSLKMYFQCG